MSSAELVAYNYGRGAAAAGDDLGVSTADLAVKIDRTGSALARAAFHRLGAADFAQWALAGFVTYHDDHLSGR